MTLHLNGIGACLPHRVVTNESLAAMVRVGAGDAVSALAPHVRRRHLSLTGLDAGDLAAAAARQALAATDFAPEEVGLVVVASTFQRSGTPPTTGELVRRSLGLDRAKVCDLGTPVESRGQPHDPADEQHQCRNPGAGIRKPVNSRPPA